MVSRILIFGANGQVGRELTAAAAERGHHVHALTRAEADIADATAVSRAVEAAKPQIIVNAAAYTAVDKAEDEPELAYRINRDGAGVLAAAAARIDIPLIHISTDYVFDGKSTRPYREEDPIAPLGVYGASKEAGERAVRAASAKHLILRTAWVYSPYGTNFVRTMLRLAAERPELGIVDDQTGCPTSAADIASAILAMIGTLETGSFEGWGTYHFAGADTRTWYQFARAIFAEASSHGGPSPRLKPIATADYPTRAPRPAYSVLDTTKFDRSFQFHPRPLRDSLAECLDRLFQEKRRSA